MTETTNPIERAVAFVRRHSKQDPVFAKGVEKVEIAEAREIIAEIDQKAAAGANGLAAITTDPVPPEESGWSYNVQTAQITDANGLKVANDVLPEDAPLIMLAPALRRAADDFYAQWFGSQEWVDAKNRLSDMLDTIDAHEQQSVPRAQGCRLPAAETPAMALLLFEALEYEREPFDDGGDFMEWFARWRERAKAVLTDGGKLRIGVTMEGGLIQSVFADREMPGVEVVVIDYDTEGADDLTDVRQIDSLGKSDEWTPAVVTRHAVNPVPQHDWSADFREHAGDEGEEA